MKSQTPNIATYSELASSALKRVALLESSFLVSKDETQKSALRNEIERCYFRIAVYRLVRLREFEQATAGSRLKETQQLDRIDQLYDQVTRLQVGDVCSIDLRRRVVRIALSIAQNPVHPSLPDAKSEALQEVSKRFASSLSGGAQDDSFFDRFLDLLRLASCIPGRNYAFSQHPSARRLADRLRSEASEPYYLGNSEMT